jgi:hypothetical protein
MNLLDKEQGLVVHVEGVGLVSELF